VFGVVLPVELQRICLSELTFADVRVCLSFRPVFYLIFILTVLSVYHCNFVSKSPICIFEEPGIRLALGQNPFYLVSEATANPVARRLVRCGREAWEHGWALRAQVSAGYDTGPCRAIEEDDLPPPWFEVNKNNPGTLPRKETEAELEVWVQGAQSVHTRSEPLVNSRLFTNFNVLRQLLIFGSSKIQTGKGQTSTRVDSGAAGRRLL
jgi:hypothetical protein